MYNFILDKLFLLESESEYRAQINKLLVKATLLYEKNLISQTKSHLEKALKIAEDFEDYNHSVLVKHFLLDVTRKTLLGSDLLEKGTKIFNSALEDIDRIKMNGIMVQLIFVLLISLCMSIGQEIKRQKQIIKNC